MEEKKLRPVNIEFVRYIGPETEDLKPGERGMLGKVPVEIPAIPPSWAFWKNKNGCEKGDLEHALLVLDEELFEKIATPNNADFLDFFGPQLARSTRDLNALAVIYTPIGHRDPRLTDVFIHGRFEAMRAIAGTAMRYTFTRFWTSHGWAQ